MRFFLCSAVLGFLAIFSSIDAKAKKYPEFDNHPHLTVEAKNRLRPFLLPLNHPIKPILDSLFSSSRLTQNKEELEKGGFQIISTQANSYITVAKHPLMPGYVLKLYLDSEIREKEKIPGWMWLYWRCEGALNVKNLISRKKIKFFKVPQKWLYPLPETPASISSEPCVQHPIILIAEEMPVQNSRRSLEAWKSKITEKHLDELYCILSYGYASSCLENNIPYIGNGCFACIDTEHPHRRPRYGLVRKYLTPHMRHYWTQKVLKKQKKHSEG